VFGAVATITRLGEERLDILSEINFSLRWRWQFGNIDQLVLGAAGSF
jgi:hypothetical protein